MEATMAQSLGFSKFIYLDKPASRRGGSVPDSWRLKDKRELPVLVSCRFSSKNRVSHRRGNAALEVSCLYKSFPGSVLESETQYAPEALLLKNKSEEVEPYLNGRCIYLVGMMGSGKTTVGKVLAQALGYSFRDSDSMVEQEVDGTSVADIFKLHGEIFFRNKETEVLKKLSSMCSLVVSTGGGAVVRPINWEYMHKGLSVWLDVPLEALAERIAKVGSDSRPLLPREKDEILKYLSRLLEERGEAYENATVKVSLENIAAKLGLRDVDALTPNMIAIEALDQIARFPRLKESRSSF